MTAKRNAFTSAKTMMTGEMKGRLQKTRIFQLGLLPSIGPPLARFGRYFGVRKVVPGDTFGVHSAPLRGQKTENKNAFKTAIICSTSLQMSGLNRQDMQATTHKQHQRGKDARGRG